MCFGVAESQSLLVAARVCRSCWASRAWRGVRHGGEWHQDGFAPAQSWFACVRRTARSRGIMNEDAIRERARERLATGELASVLGVTIAAMDRAHEPPRRAGWLVAATLFLGLAAAVGTAWLRPDPDHATLQDRGPVDVVHPWWERYVPPIKMHRVTSEATAAALPADADWIMANLSSQPHDWWHTLLAQPNLHTLALNMSGPQALSASEWRSVGQLPELTCLWVSSEEELDAGLLRELRRAPKL